MKTKMFLWAILAIALSFSACTKEEENLVLPQEELLSEESAETEGEVFASLEQSAEAIIRSLDLSMKGLPAYVNEIIVTPQGAIDPNGETRVVIAAGTFTSNIPVKAQDLASGEILAIDVLIGSGSMSAVALPISAYKTSTNTSSRVIGFFYLGSTNQWELFHYETQAPTTVQKPFCMIPLDKQSYYLADGNNYSFKMEANKAWKATILSDPNHLLASIKTTSGNAGIQNFTFKTKYSNKGGTATIRFTSGTEFQDIQIHIKPAGSFIVIPSPALSYQANGKFYNFDIYSSHMWKATISSGMEFFKSYQVVGTTGSTAYTFTTNNYKARGRAVILFEPFVSNGESQVVILNFNK